MQEELFTTLGATLAIASIIAMGGMFWLGILLVLGVVIGLLKMVDTDIVVPYVVGVLLAGMVTIILTSIAGSVVAAAGGIAIGVALVLVGTKM